jgi:hypothetical protein
MPRHRAECPFNCREGARPGKPSPPTAEAEPERFRYETATGVTDERIAIERSPETFDRRGRTQGYQAVWAGRASRTRRRAEIPGQTDLFSELDEAERVATEEESNNDTEAAMTNSGGPEPDAPSQTGQQAGTASNDGQGGAP